MGQITRYGPLSGQAYNFTIGSDAPTADEELRIDSILRQQESDRLAAINEQYGTDYRSDDGWWISNQVGEFFKGIPSGAVNLGESAALGIAALLPEDSELKAREAIRQTAISARKPFAPDIGLEDTVAGNFGQAVGSFLPLVASYAVPGVGPGIAASMATGAGAGEASERARAAGATEDERSEAALWGAGVGFSELLPVKALWWLNKSGWGGALARIAQEGSIEAAQEAFAEAAQNMIAQGVYNPEQEITEGILPSAGYGGGVGALIQTLSEVFIPRSRRAGSTTPAAAQQTPATKQQTPATKQQTPTTTQATPEAVAQAQAELEAEVDAEADTATVAAQAATTPKATVQARRETVEGMYPDLTYDGQPIDVEDIPNLFAATSKDPAKLTDVETISKATGLTPPQVAEVISLLRPGTKLAEEATRQATNLVAGQEAVSPDVDTEIAAGRAEAVQVELPRESTADAVKATRAEQAKKATPGKAQPLTAEEQQQALANTQVAAENTGELLDQAREETADAAAAEPETITDEVLASIGMPVGYAARKQLASGAPQEKVRQTLQTLVDGEGKFSAPVRELLRRTSPEQRAAGDGAAATGRSVGARQTGTDGRPGRLAGSGAGRVGQPSGNVLVAPTGAQGGADTLALNAAPGATTGTAGQVIPEPTVRPSLYTPQPAQRYDQKLKRVVARREPTEIEQRIEQAAARTASEEKTRATQEFAAWRTKNVPPLVRALSRDYDEGMGHIPDVTTARDRQKILGILRKLPKWDMTKRPERSRRLTDKEFAAGRYFLRNENPMHALELIAHDAVYGSNVADPEAELRDMKRSGKAGEAAAKRLAKQAYSVPKGMDLNSPEVQYHRFTGRSYATLAREWINDNLSQDVKDYTNQVAAKNNADLSREFNYYHRMSNPDNDVTTVPRGDLEMQQRYKSDAQRRQAKADLFKATERAAADYDLQSRVNKAGVSLPPAPEGMDMSFLVALNPYGELAMPLHPTVVAALVNGNLESALKSLAMTGISKDMKRLAAALAPYVGNTKVYLEYKGDPYYDVHLAPKKRSGAYVVTPDTDSAYNDAIIISADAATPHTLLHEAVHMATHKTLGDPNDPMTAALNKLYRQFESNLKNYYGGKMDLKEFVAEGLSNNHFRAELRRYRPTGEKISAIKTGWDMFVQPFINKIRNWLGKPPKNITTTALSELDRMAYQIMQPTPGLVKETEVSYLTRAAGKAALQRAFNREKPFSVANAMQALSTFVADKIPQGVKNFTAGFIPLANLEEMSKGVFGKDIGGRLLDIANEMSSTLHNTHQEINASLHPMRDWLDSDVVTPEVKRAFITMVYESTRNQVDMALTQEQFLKSDALNKLSFADAQDKKKVYQTLKPYVDIVRAAGGMGHYKRMRNTFEMLRQQAQEVFKDRMMAITKDKTKTDAVYNELVKKMFSDHLLDPYTPLTRTGDYWLVYTAKDPIFGNTELFKQSFETVSARELAREQLQDMMAGANPGGIADVEIYNNIRTGQQVRRELPALFAKELTDLLDKNGLTADDTIRMQVTDLILDSIPERSFLNSFRGRKEGAGGQAGMKGWTGDNTPLGDDSGGFLGTMHGKMSGMARQIARMQGSAKAQVYRADLAKRAAELSADPRNNPHVISTLQQELDRNADMLGRIDRASWSRDVTGGLFFMTLGFNLSSAIVNMFALPTIVLGHLAGQYGMVKTAKAMGEATKLIAGSGTKRKVRRISEELGPNGEVQYEMVDDAMAGPLSYGILNYDLDDPKNAKIRFLKYLVHEGEKRNQLGRSLVFEMADIDETTDTTGLSSSVRGKWDQVRALSGAPFHHSERYARETTMISTYLLELRKLAKGNDFSKLTEADFKQAAYDAVTTTELVNSSVAAAAAPRLAKGDWGSVFLMYKRYMLAMINLQLMQMKQAVAGADPEARRAARWQLAYTYGLLTAFSGVAGVPIYNVVETAWNAFFDDEDEEDFGTLTRIALGELGYKGALNYITGREMASRIGLQDMLFREPVVEQGWPWDYLVGFGGPAVGMTMNIGRAWDLAWEGEGIRSLEAIAPASVRNLVRAGIRYPTEGARTMRGDPVIDDINIVDMIGQAIGFAPARYVQALELNKQYKEIDKAIAEERSKLVKKLNIARRDGDFYRMRELRKDIAEFNRENPQYPVEADTLKRSADQFAKTSDKMIHGVSFNAANLAMIKKMMQAWGEPTFWGA